MVERDHALVDPIEALFNESMRRDAMRGTRTVFTLETKEKVNNRNTSSASRTELTPRGSTRMIAECIHMHSVSKA